MKHSEEVPSHSLEMAMVLKHLRIPFLLLSAKDAAAYIPHADVRFGADAANDKDKENHA